MSSSNTSDPPRPAASAQGHPPLSPTKVSSNPVAAVAGAQGPAGDSTNDLSFSDIGSFADIDMFADQLTEDDDISAFAPSGGGAEIVSLSPAAAADHVPSSTSTSNATEPNKNDVLLGRGGKNNQHSGNEQLRRLARDMSGQYAAAPKRNKPSIAWLLVTKIRSLQPPGRYVPKKSRFYFILFIHLFY